MLGTVNDLLSVERPERAAIVAQLMRQLLHVAAVGVHGVDVEIAVPHRGENDLLSIAADGGFRIVARSLRELLRIAAVQIGRVDVIRAVNRPYVTLGIVGLGWAFCSIRPSGRVQNFSTAGKYVAARGSANSAAEQLRGCRFAVSSVDGHGVNLVARPPVTLVLKNQRLVVNGEVR